MSTVVALLASLLPIAAYATAGWLLTTYKLLPDNTTVVLGRVQIYLLLPALLFNSVSYRVSLSALAQLFAVPLALLATLLLGGALGALTARVTRVSHSVRRTFIAAVAVPNGASIPLSLAAELFARDTALFASLDNATLVLAYLALGIVVNEIVIWSAVYPLLAAPAPLSIRLDAVCDAAEFDSCESLDADDAGGGEVATNSSSCGYCPLWVRRVINAPLVAVLFGLIVGVSPMKHWFHATDGAAPLQFATNLLTSAGACVVPLLLLIFGCTVARFPLRRLCPSKDDDLTWAVIASTCLLRLIVIPSVIFSFCFFVLRQNQWIDDTATVCILMQCFAPSNIGLLIIAQVHGHNERETAQLVFWTTSFSLLTMLAWLIGFSQTLQ